MFDYTPPAPPLPTIAASEMVFTNNNGKRIIIPEGTKLSNDMLAKFNATQTFEALQTPRKGRNCYVPINGLRDLSNGLNSNVPINGLRDLSHGLTSQKSARRVKKE